MTRGVFASIVLWACSEGVVEPSRGEPADQPSGSEAPAPVVSRVKPPILIRGATLDLRVFGSGFDAGSDVRVDAPTAPATAVVTNATHYVSSSELLVSVTTAADAPAGPYEVIVTGGTGKQGVGTELIDFTPVISTVRPSPAEPGEAVSIVGRNFGADRGSIDVTFDGREGSVLSATDSLVVAVVPFDVPVGTIGVELSVAGVSGTASATLEVAAEAAAPQPPESAGRRLAFVHAGDIYTVNEDGNDPVRLTRDGASGQPAWSPDGLRIAFVRNGDEIHLMNADGSGVRRFAAGLSPAWSPDGRRIAFSALSDGQTRIFVKAVDVEGAPAVPIGFDRGVNSWPAWSPDGSRIAFVSDATAFDFANDIYTAKADGSDVTQITNGFASGNGPSWTIYSQPAWSPDGSTLAVLTCQEWQFTTCGTSSIGILAVDGSHFRPLAQTTGLARPSWSSDGAAVAFSRTCWDHQCPSDVFIVAPEGSAERLLIADGHNAAWRP